MERKINAYLAKTYFQHFELLAVPQIRITQEKNKTQLRSQVLTGQPVS